MVLYEAAPNIASCKASSKGFNIIHHSTLLNTTLLHDGAQGGKTISTILFISGSKCQAVSTPSNTYRMAKLVKHVGFNNVEQCCMKMLNPFV